MKRSIDGAARVYFALATAFLVVLAIVLLGWAAWEIVDALLHGEVLGVLDSVGLVIIGFAILETARFIAEEELVRRPRAALGGRGAALAHQVRHHLVIAVSLEALVMVFEAGRTEMERRSIRRCCSGRRCSRSSPSGRSSGCRAESPRRPTRRRSTREDEIDHRAPDEPEA